MGNRKAAEKFILDFFSKIDKSGYNTKTWVKILEGMSDKAFDEYMRNIREGKAKLVLYAPLYKTSGITVDNNLKLAEEYGIELFEQLIVHDPVLGTYKTAQKFLIMGLGIKVLSQSLDKKAIIPDDNRSVDQLTYTPTGASKGSTLSKPEMGLYIGMGLHNVVQELGAIRGGDKGGFRAYNSSIDKLGSVSLASLTPYRTGVESTKAVKAYFTSVHLDLEI